MSGDAPPAATSLTAASLDRLGRGAGQPDMVRHLWTRIHALWQRCRAVLASDPAHRLSPLSPP